MSSNHLFIEPAQPENAHNHHSSLIEGCPSSCPLYELRKVDGVRNILFNSALDNQKKKACPLTLAEEVKGWEDKLDNQLCVLGQVNGLYSGMTNVKAINHNQK